MNYRKLRKILLPVLMFFYALYVVAEDQNSIKVTVEYKTVWFWDETKIAKDTNEKYSIEWDEKGLKGITINEENANIRDFSFFTRGLYRQYLQSKLHSGGELTRGEIELLYVCLITEVSAVNSYSFVFAKEIGMENEIYPHLLPHSNPDVNAEYRPIIHDRLYKMQQNFISDKKSDIAKSKILDFAKFFKGVNRNIIEEDLKRLKNDRRKDLWRKPWYWPFSKIVIEEGLVSTYDDCDISPRNFVSIWSSVCKRDDLCLENIKEIREGMDKYLKNAENASIMRIIDSLDLYTYESIDKYVGSNLLLFNDFPAIVCANKCLSNIQKSKKDKVKMKDAMIDFVRCMRGEKFPLRMSSAYSSSLYTTITQKMKDELGEAEWEEFKLSAALVNINDLDDIFSIKKENKQ